LTVLPLLLSAPVPGGAAVLEQGDPAPRFELPVLGGHGYLASHDKYSAYEATFVIFWSAECPECVESLRRCQEFHSTVTGGDISVLGVNGDEGGLLEVREIVEASGVDFVQLHDGTGLAAARYGVPPSSFAVFLVDRKGIVQSAAVDPQGDVYQLMEDMLMGEAVGESLESSGGGVSAYGFSLHGLARIKYLSIDTRGEDAQGPYGQSLQAGNSLLQRYELEIAKSLGRHVRVGGLLRISNEGIEVLRAGPDYLDSEWGSVFGQIDYGWLSLRLGYYEMHMTPLTMMRWDWDDNPRTGGDAGCGCGPAGGVLIVESVEELGPDLVFEGVRARLSSGEFETDVFYAMPRRARSVPVVAWQLIGEEMAAYSMEIYGLQTRWRRHDRRTGSFWSAGLHFLGSWEDPRSVDEGALGYAPFERYTSGILTATANLPIVSHVDLRGEWIMVNKAKGYNLGPGHDEEVDLSGSGGTAGLALDDAGPVDLNIDYLRLAKEFYSPFVAISYQPGRHGMRINGRVRLPGGWSALSVFYKRLESIDEVAGMEKENLSFTGVTIDADLESGPGGSISVLDRGEWRGGDTLPYDSARRTYTLSARYRFLKNTFVEGMYQRVETEESPAGMDTGSDTNLYSVYFRSEF
jgi:peroxiredoxin